MSIASRFSPGTEMTMFNVVKIMRDKCMVRLSGLNGLTRKGLVLYGGALEED